jgi:uncharacterized protein
MNKHCGSIILLLTLLRPALFAQSLTDTPATPDDIKSLFTLMHIRDQIQPAMEYVARQQRAIIYETLKRQNPRISREDMARLDQFTADIMKDLPVDGMLDDMIPVYQKHLSRSDVEAMTAFYSSPTGQKLLREMPAMTAESMQAASPRIQALMDKVVERAQAMSKENDQKNAAPKVPNEKSKN